MIAEEVEGRLLNRVGGYREFAPPHELRAWLESYWVHKNAPQTAGVCSAHRVVLDPGISLAFTCVRNGAAVESPALTVMGPVHHLRTFVPGPGLEMVCLRIKMEYAGSILGVSPTEHRDAKDDYLRIRPRVAEPLIERLAALRSSSHVLAALVTEVERWLRCARSTPRRRERVPMELLRRTAGRVRVDVLARHLGMSPRSIHRLVSDGVGMPPKLYSRLLRFHGVLSAADRLKRPDWATLAAAAGYYDQSHMIRDFQEFARATPARLHRDRRAESEISNPS